MAEILHLWALAPAAVGTCCIAAGRRRLRAPELVASAVMLLAMLDLVRAQPLLVPVAWAAVLLVAAMALAALRGVQQRRADAARSIALGAGMTVHTTIGMVVMAALVLLMGAGPGSAVTGSMGGMAGMHSSGGGGALPVLVALAVAAYAVASVAATIRAHTRLDRAQFVAMGASTTIMALAVFS